MYICMYVKCMYKAKDGLPTVWRAILSILKTASAFCFDLAYIILETHHRNKLVQRNKIIFLRF
jgi:hypothetical protein